MVNLLRLAACLFLCVSLNSFGYTTIRVQAEGVISLIHPTHNDSLNEAVSIGDSWNATILYDVYSNLSPNSPSNNFNAGNARGIINVANESLLISRSNVDIGTNSWDGVDQLYISHGTDPLMYLNGIQCCDYNFRLHQGAATNPFLNLPWGATIEDVFSSFSFQLPNDSIIEIRPGAGNLIEGSVQNLSVTIVPLPAGIYLFLSGLVGLGLMRGRNA